MKVLLNAVGAQMGGAHRHLRSLVCELDRLNSAIQYTVLVRAGVFDFGALSQVAVKEISIELLDTVWRRLEFDRQAIPNILARDSFGACISLLNFGPRHCPCPHVVFQRNALYFDRTQLAQTPLRERLGYLARRAQAVSVIKGADFLVTPSAAMAEQVQAHSAAIRAKPFVVLPHAFDFSTYDSPMSEAIGRTLAAAQGIRILYPAHLARHKAFDLLLDVAARLRDSGLSFTILLTIESKDWPEGYRNLETRVLSEGLKSCVLNLGTVPQDQMGAVYRACDVVFYPSLCESFGFALVEALAFGLPIVASDRPVNREIGGTASIYYEANHAEEAAARLLELQLPERRAERRALTQRQFAAGEWSWKHYAREFERIAFLAASMPRKNGKAFP